MREDRPRPAGQDRRQQSSFSRHERMADRVDGLMYPVQRTDSDSVLRRRLIHPEEAELLKSDQPVLALCNTRDSSVPFGTGTPPTGR